MTGNTQFNVDDSKAGRMDSCDNVKPASLQALDQTSPVAFSTQPATDNQITMTGEVSASSQDQLYWKMRYESLKRDYDHLQKLNQNLEEKLLNIVEIFEKKREELIANAEFEKSTLMADVDKLSTKLVDARMRLHDREEKEVLHAAECSAPCHIKLESQNIKTVPTTDRAPAHRLEEQKQKQQMINDPNLV